MAQSPRPAYNPHNDFEHINDLLSTALDQNNLSDWENDFLEDLSTKIEHSVGVTPAQYKKLKEIAEKDDDFEVW